LNVKEKVELAYILSIILGIFPRCILYTQKVDPVLLLVSYLTKVRYRVCHETVFCSMTHLKADEVTFYLLNY